MLLVLGRPWVCLVRRACRVLVLGDGLFGVGWCQPVPQCGRHLMIHSGYACSRCSWPYLQWARIPGLRYSLPQ